MFDQRATLHDHCDRLSYSASRSMHVNEYRAAQHDRNGEVSRLIFSPTRSRRVLERIETQFWLSFCNECGTVRMGRHDCVLMIPWKLLL